MYNKEDYIDDLKDYIKEKKSYLVEAKQSVLSLLEAYDNSDKSEYFKKSKKYGLKILKEEIKTNEKIIKILEDSLEEEK